MQHHHADPQVREARPTDADQLFAMAQLLATSATPQQPAFGELLGRILDDQNQCLLVAETPRQPVGYLYGLAHPAFHANGNIAWVEELYVDPGQRRAGVGRKLMAAFEQWALQTVDAQYIAVATRRAQDFYRTIGYTESATYFKRDLR